METIKFRAIDQFGEDFIYGQAFFIDSDNGQGYISDGIDKHHCVKKETAGQSTGLKDKNKKGNEVYEDDCFEIIFWDVDKDKEIKVTGVVVSFMAQYMIKYIHPRYKDERFSNLFEFLRDKNKEIIGDIHTTPELLKSK